MLIVLRGNSGSGKTTTAYQLRDTPFKQNSSQKIAVIEQDYLRRKILKEKERDDGDNIDLIHKTVNFALEREYIVILEGILFSRRYQAMLENLATISKTNHFYYFDISFEETLKRHSTKPNSHEFGEKEMREWYREKDFLAFTREKIIPESLSQDKIIAMILNDII